VPAAKTETKAATEPEVVTPEQTPEEIEAEIARVEAEAEDFAIKFNTAELNKANKQLRVLDRQLGEAKARQSAKQTAYDTAFTESAARSAQAYPDAAKEGTPLHAAIKADVERLEKVNPSFFNDPEWVETLTYKNAGKLGLAKAAAPAATTATPAKVTAKVAVKQPLKPTRPVPGPAAGGTPVATESTEQAIRAELEAAKARGDGDAVDKIILRLEARQKAAA
jgi:hypothetical protein